VGTIVSVAFGEPLLEALLDLGDDSGQKGSAGYVVAAPVPGPRSNAAAEPTRVLALDYDDCGPAGPDWGALAHYEYLAYTTDSHTDADPHWRVWVLLDRPYTQPEVGVSFCPLEGCFLRAISQPVYLPTRVSDVEWVHHTGRPLRLTEEWGLASAEPAPAAAEAYSPPSKKTVPSQASTNALVTRWLSRPEGTNRLAGATGAALAEWGWSDEEVRDYLEAWLSADPKLAKHTDDAVRGARKRRAGDRIVGFPTLTAEGVDFAPEAPAGGDVEALWAAVAAEAGLSPAEARPGPDAPDDGDPWRFEYGTTVAAWDPPPVRWVCEGLCLAPGAPGLITGYGGSGKTTFVQHLALCVVSGKPLLGQYAVRQGAVTHLDYEQGSDLTRRRYLQLGLSDLPEDALSRLRFRSFPQAKLDGSEETLRLLLRAAAGQTLLIVDSLIAASVLEDGENSSAARGPLDVLGQVSDLTGCAVLVIHHSKKDRSNGRTSARGSSAITDAVSLHITYEKDDEAGLSSPARLRLEKVRHILPAGAAVEGFSVGQSSAGVLSLVDEGEADQKTNEVETRIITLLSDGVPKSFNWIAGELQVNRNTASAVVKNMVQEKTLVRTAAGLTLGGIGL
jgi:hypothetical protein